MNRIRYIIPLLVAAVLISGCEKVIDSFDFIESDPRLVINAPITADSAIIIHVSHTIGIMDEDLFNYDDDALAAIYSNQNLLAEASYIDSGFYTFPALPEHGTQYTLKVESEGFPDAEATFTIPDLPVLSSVEFDGEDENGIRMKITIDDPAGDINAYGISLIFPYGYIQVDDFGNPVDTVFEGKAYAYLRSKDINVSGGMHYSSLSTEKWDDYSDGATLLIEDNLVNGSEFTISLSTPDLYFAVLTEQAITAQLESYSEDYVKYLKSMEMYENSIENPIAEKVSLFTNIEGGLGVAHGKSITRTSFTIPADQVSGGFIQWDK